MHVYSMCAGMHVYTEHPNFLLTKALNPPGLIKACWVFVWLLQNVFDPLGFSFNFQNNRLRCMQAFPCKLLFFRRYGQKVGPAAVSIGYQAILKQPQNHANGLLCRSSWLKDRPVYTVLFVKCPTPVLGGARTCWVTSSTCCVNGPRELGQVFSAAQQVNRLILRAEEGKLSHELCPVHLKSPWNQIQCLGVFYVAHPTR